MDEKLNEIMSLMFMQEHQETVIVVIARLAAIYEWGGRTEPERALEIIAAKPQGSRSPVMLIHAPAIGDSDNAAKIAALKDAIAALQDLLVERQAKAASGTN